MTRKRILALLIAVIVVAGGILGVKLYMDAKANEAHQAYVTSPDRIADQLRADLTSGNAPDAYANLFTDLLKENYSVKYWQRIDSPFTLLKGYKAAPQLNFKKPTSQVQPTALYPQGANPQTYQYSYRVNDVTYRVTFVVASIKGVWKINQLDAGYVQ